MTRPESIGIRELRQHASRYVAMAKAGRLPDPLLRSLDAIHLATALMVREEVDVLLTYDERLATAAQAHGIPTAAPA